MKHFFKSLTFLLCLSATIAFGQKRVAKLPKTPKTDLATHKNPQETKVIYPKAAVVSAHPEASSIGTQVLREGGNAIDAAVAVQFALAVCLPVAGNIGGGGFAVYRFANGENGSIDFRETAPVGASETMYLDADGNVLEDQNSKGIKSSGVPGTVDGMWQLHQKFGKLPWARLVMPAINMAKDGVKLTAKEADMLNQHLELLKRFNPSGCAFTVKDEWQEGDLLLQPILASTLETIAKEGRDGFYSGWVASEIANFESKNGGLINTEDLQSYASVFRNPIHEKVGEYTITSMPPPSSGGIGLIQMMKMVWPKLKSVGSNKSAYYHLLTEAERRFYADRARYLGDPDFVKNPTTTLMNDTYVFERFRDFDSTKATPSTKITSGEQPAHESDQTTHYSIVDAEGNAISVTTTLNGPYGSYCVVPACGFLLNNEMDDFSIKPGVPNMYGVIGGKANAIEPKKRMLSSMSPTIVTKNNKLFMVVGTPGGSTIITSVLQTILNVTHFKMSMQEAVNAPRMHHQWLPDEIKAEESVPETLIESLKKKGHQFQKVKGIGRVDAILIQQNGKLECGADHRGDDAANGF
jgi:gamma-glutamyltranspeptidase/glutathione hydrolase